LLCDIHVFVPENSNPVDSMFSKATVAKELVNQLLLDLKNMVLFAAIGNQAMVCTFT
jgi:hypothetical protein